MFSSDDEGISFPTVAAENIAGFLNGYELINLSYTCKYWYEIAKLNSVWKTLVRKRFGEESLRQQEASETNFKRVYFTLGSNIRSVSCSKNIVHLDGRYLEKRVDSESYNGEVLRLNDVCWLQVDDKFSSVLPGRYNVQWRMKLHHTFVNGNPIEFRAKVRKGNGSSICSKWSEGRFKEAEKRHGTGQWFDADMGTITVEKTGEVEVQIWGRVDYWCGGITWDTVKLKYANDKEKTSAKEKRKKQTSVTQDTNVTQDPNVGSAKPCIIQ